MQGIQTYLVFALCCLGHFTFAQQEATDSLNKKRDPIDVNFLFNYYSQDGVHSAVTGGIGTEELKDYATIINIIVPVDSANQLSVEAGANVYTSASTDLIDSRMSSASSIDTRSSIYFDWEQYNKRARTFVNWKMGGSVESDYLSLSLGWGWTKQSKDENRLFSIQAQAFFDRWILYFPAELRDTIIPTVDTDKRRSFNLNLNYQQVLNPRMQFSISADINLQRGFLSTPFHRVYFQEETLPRIEKFPGTRWRYPLGLRLNYYATDFMILRLFYRYYWESFGVQAHTFNIEAPIKATSSWTISPFYRYYTQGAADFFLPFRAHTAGAEFYTSDFDLSAFHSHKFGLGLRFTPLWQLSAPQAKLQWEISTIAFRFSHYRRSDGLRAWSLSTFWGITN